jgi:hypothetical protein
MERALPTAAVDFLFGGTRLGQRGFSGDSDEGVQPWVELLNAAEARCSQLHRGDLLAVHKLRRFGESQRRETCIVGNVASFDSGRIGRD